MNVYIYQADLLCEDCGIQICAELTKAGKDPQDKFNEYTYDSDDFPKGPYPDGGGEADSPNHCGMHEECLNAMEIDHGGKTYKVGCFLENPLTEEGYDYVKSASPDGLVANMWKEYYDV